MMNQDTRRAVYEAVRRAVYSAVAGDWTVYQAVYLAVYGAATGNSTSSHPGLMLYLKEVARCRT